jgi:hypothetical protein
MGSKYTFDPLNMNINMFIIIIMNMDTDTDRDIDMDMGPAEICGDGSDTSQTFIQRGLKPT